MVSALADLGDVVVEVITPEGEDVSSTLLAAFICFHGSTVVKESQFDDILNLAISERQRSYVAKLETDLSTVLPRYMIPIYFIPVSRIPKTISGKTDRKLLQDALSRFSMQQMQQFTLAINIPFHDMGRHLAFAWAKLLTLT